MKPKPVILTLTLHEAFALCDLADNGWGDGAFAGWGDTPVRFQRAALRKLHAATAAEVNRRNPTAPPTARSDSCPFVSIRG